MVGSEKVFSGLGVSPGLGVGEAFPIYGEEIPIPLLGAGKGKEEEEKNRFFLALKEMERILEELRKEVQDLPIREPVMMVDVHLSFLQDPVFQKGVLSRIEQGETAERAVYDTFQGIERSFQRVSDPYIRERLEDLRHLYRRLMHFLLETDLEKGIPEEHHVVVSKVFSAQEILRFGKKKPRALVAEGGSPLSHAVILARMLKIPMVIGVKGILGGIQKGQILLANGFRGEVIVNPHARTIRRHQSRTPKLISEKVERDERGRVKAVSRDGYSCEIFANGELLEEIPLILESGAWGIGLFRTEYLFVAKGSSLFLEEMEEYYGEVVRRMGGLPVTFRTLDLGGDKLPDEWKDTQGENPSMGLRGIRLSLRFRELLEKQLRAILRASRIGPVRILLPMVSVFQELKSTQDLLRDLAKEEGIPPPPLGVMIETPSSALIVDVLAQEADFFSIGTNDLFQYTFAVDRNNEWVNYLYDPLHLGFLRILYHIAQSAKRCGKSVEVCGELAGDPRFVYLFMGMGVRTFSMNAILIPHIAQFICRSELNSAQETVMSLMALRQVEERDRVLERALRERFSDLFG
jgi:phosphotransferase system enzyme I (PtsI)